MMFGYEGNIACFNQRLEWAIELRSNQVMPRLETWIQNFYESISPEKMGEITNRPQYPTVFNRARNDNAGGEITQ